MEDSGLEKEQKRKKVHLKRNKKRIMVITDISLKIFAKDCPMLIIHLFIIKIKQKEI
jgi:hypothetical protein